MKIIYLASHIAKHPNWDIIYQDITGKRDIGGDMLDVDLIPYDVIIATPPCNYWSRANYRRETSGYAQKTKHLLPQIIDKLILLNKPFIIENVRNKKLFNNHGLYDKKCIIFEHGRHTYWTNINFEYKHIEQINDFKAENKKLDNGMWLTPKGKIVKSNGVIRISDNSLGGDNVYLVIEEFLKSINKILD